MSRAPTAHSSVTEAPFKQHHYVSLLIHLTYAATDEDEAKGEAEESGDADKPPAEADEVEYARQVIDELGRAFRSSVEGRQWRNARLLLQFLSLLVPARLVDSRSLLQVFKGLLAVVNEVGGGGDRAERAVRAVGEGLIRSAHALAPEFREDVDSVIASMEAFIDGRKGDRALSNPLAPILAGAEEATPYADVSCVFYLTPDIVRPVIRPP